jgi:DNA polymerase-4
MNLKLGAPGVKTCADLQEFDQIDLVQRFGRWGYELWHLCRGIDERPIAIDKIRKSLSSETTFSENIETLQGLISPMHAMIEGLAEDLAAHHHGRLIRSLVVKFKFADFERTTAERSGRVLDVEVFGDLLAEAWKRGNHRAARLLGVGVRFEDPGEPEQMEFF